MAEAKRDPSHKLWVWMQSHGLTDQKMADRLGCSKRTVFRWLTEGHAPDLNLAQKVYDVTDAYVTLMDWPTDYTAEKKAALKKAMAGARRKASKAAKGKA